LPDKLCFGQPPISARTESRPALCLTNARGGDINFKPGDDDRDRPSPLAAAMKLLRLWSLARRDAGIRFQGLDRGA
jgi:hypothetical protein